MLADRVEQMFDSAQPPVRATGEGVLRDRRARYLMISVTLMVALLAFEVFNFDTTQYALDNLLGDVRFVGVRWATILAIAFCGIDFAGLLRVFTPDDADDASSGTSTGVWYMMAAWLLGATMNALMTWYAVSLTLVQHDIGNEVLSRGQLLAIVPPFVAFLVWLTRILFIGALSIAGSELLDRALTVERPASLPQPPVAAPVPLRAVQHATPIGAPVSVRPAPEGYRRQRPVVATDEQTEISEAIIVPPPARPAQRHASAR